ncbi:DUF2065 domain-containing protein [Aestuariivirga sp.]|uniref:DUF2065 domain-containing protein n=1 Tax=Aestuariivirga sp. TaxID=2650926 RepID=UPI0035B4B7BC
MLGYALTALGLVLVIEGLLYALVPAQLKAMMASVQKLSDDQLRIAGVAAMATGVMAVWLVHAAFF